MKPYEKYAEEIPQEATQIVESLHDPIRRAILVLLNKSSELSFSDMKNELELGKLTLNYHLKNLYAAGLTDHYFRHELGNQKYSYYAITSLGRRVMINLINALIPPVPFQKTSEEETFTARHDLAPHTGTICLPNYWRTNRKKPMTVFTPSCATTELPEHLYGTNHVKYTKSE